MTMDRQENTPRKPRARELGLPFGGITGTHNAITDVPHVAVGLKSLQEAAPRRGHTLPVRTGVTAILPHPAADAPTPVFAGVHRFNGNGEMTGTHWIEDGGYFLGPVTITNTHSVGMVHHSTVKWMLERYRTTYYGSRPRWIMPVVAETFDGILNDINTLALGEDEVLTALNAASDGPVAEGNTGGGTAMIAYGFKGGTGTASRRLKIGSQNYTVGVLVQANHGQRDWLTICGVPVGQHLAAEAHGADTTERGSIIVIVATDIPMAPHQLKRVARRCSIGIGRNGTPGGNNSGDIFLAFSTANAIPLNDPPDIHRIEMLDDELFDPVYMAVVDCTEEAVINALLAAEDMVGTRDHKERIEAMPTDRVLDIMKRYGRLSVVAGNRV